MNLIINAGSATLKLAVFEGSVKKASGLYDIKGPSDYERVMREFLKGKNPSRFVHRMVHGGGLFRKPTKVNKAILKKLEALDSLAPLHNPVARLAVKACMNAFPKIPHHLVFDTYFHRTIPELHYRYAVPDKEVRRYGFHGIVCSSVLEQLKDCGRIKRKTILCHLGSGCSVTAVKNGLSIDTSMGMTPLEGLVMGTRAGDLDPGLVLHLVKKYGERKVYEMLSRESGLKALTGQSDMRAILKRAKKKDPKALFAIDLFCLKAAKVIASCIVSLQGFDLLVFSGGIGENSPLIRQKICDALKPFGVKIHTEKNRRARPKMFFHQFFSSVKLISVHADEEVAMNSLFL